MGQLGSIKATPAGTSLGGTISSWAESLMCVLGWGGGGSVFGGCLESSPLDLLDATAALLLGQ